VDADRPEGSEWRWPLIVGMILGSLLIGASIYLSYRFAERIGRTLGDSTMNVIIRLSSFILVCIGGADYVEWSEGAVGNDYVECARVAVDADSGMLEAQASR
jgi:hypothetical protein